MKKFFALALLLIVSVFSLPTCLAASCCDGEPITVDANDAFRRAQRKGRDPIEGFWDVQLDWHPEKDSARSYRVAIVRNAYDVFQDADYLGVADCKGKRGKGCVRGEVKMFLYRTNRPNEFDTIMVTNVGYGKGRATLGPDDEGRENAALDMRQVVFHVRPMTEKLVRVKGK